MSIKPVLGYWRIRGLAQPIRLLLAYVGQDFEDKYYECGPGPEFNKDCWFNEKFSLGLEFPNLPYFIDGETKLSQSSVILRYLARKHGLEVKNEMELNRLELAFEEAIDLRRSYVSTSYNPNFELLKADFIKQALTKLKEVDAFLGENTWFAGDSISFVDFVWYELLDQLNTLDPVILSGFDRLLQFHRRFQALPAIKQYIESDRFLSRPFNNKMARFGNQ